MATAIYNTTTGEFKLKYAKKSYLWNTRKERVFESGFLFQPKMPINLTLTTIGENTDCVLDYKGITEVIQVNRIG